MRHHISRQLRTMSRIDRKTLDDAADELDRMNNLIVDMMAQANACREEHKKQVEQLENKISALEYDLCRLGHKKQFFG